MPNMKLPYSIVAVESFTVRKPGRNVVECELGLERKATNKQAISANDATALTKTIEYTYSIQSTTSRGFGYGSPTFNKQQRWNNGGK